MFEFGSPIDRRTALRRLSLALGGVATAPLASGLLGGCRTPERDTLADYTYQALSESQQRTLAALVDRILPETDTPGAAEAGVPQFIDTMLAEWYAPEERDAFLAGLDGVDRRAQAEGGSAFADLDEEAQGRLVAALDAEAFRPAEPTEVPDESVVEAGREGTYQAQQEEQNEVAGMQGELGEAMDDSTDAGAVGEVNTGEGTVSIGEAEAPPFFRQLKELTLAGYYTSEVGATQELRYDAVMGRYDPDVPLSEIGRAWA